MEHNYIEELEIGVEIYIYSMDPRCSAACIEGWDSVLAETDVS